ncbi:MAG: hypothetical protein AAFY82_08580, partial [Pseudomonadota bacterium]
EQMQAQLQSAAEQALSDAGQTWARVEMRGQTALVTGAPPGEEAADIAVSAVQTSAGQGGLIWGGVVRVDAAFGEVEQIASVERVTERAEAAPELVFEAAALDEAAPYVWRAIKSANGTIILVGAVPSESVQADLVAQATALSENALDNRMAITSGGPDGDWSGAAAFGLEQLSLLNSGEARLTGYELRLSGISMDERARIQAAASVANLKPPWRGLADIDGPSLWKAEHIDGQLVLSGACATSESRTEIKEIAKTYFDGEVVDQLTIGSVQQSGWVEYVSLDQPRDSQSDSGKIDRSPDGDGYEVQEWSE